MVHNTMDTMTLTINSTLILMIIDEEDNCREQQVQIRSHLLDLVKQITPTTMNTTFRITER